MSRIHVRMKHKEVHKTEVRLLVLIVVSPTFYHLALKVSRKSMRIHAVSRSYKVVS